MIEWLREKWNNEPDIEHIRQKYADIYSNVEKMEGDALHMRQAFADGGDITWEQLRTYEVSTPEKPIGYPTGKNCVSYRLPDIGGRMIFRTLCIAPKGQQGSFGWHWHPKTRETNIQMDGNARHNGADLKPYSVTVFEPGQPHDYILMPGGSLITIFEKIID